MKVTLRLFYPFNERTTMHKKMASELCEEYEQRLRTGEKPDPREYFDRYTGQAKTEFRFMLNVATVFTVDGIIRRQEAAKMITDKEIQKGKEKLLRKLLGEEKIDKEVTKHKKVSNQRRRKTI